MLNRINQADLFEIPDTEGWIHSRFSGNPGAFLANVDPNK